MHSSSHALPLSPRRAQDKTPPPLPMVRTAPADAVSVAATWHAGCDNRSLRDALPALPGGGAASPAHGTASWFARKQREAEFADAVAEVLRQEKRLRSVVVGTEYERRYAMLWRHQSGLAKLQRYHAAAHARATAQEQLRYTLAVQLYQEIGLVVSGEATARDALVREECQDRGHAASLRELEVLQMEAERLAVEQARTETFFADINETREMQLSQMVRHYRAPKSNEDPIQQCVTGILLGKPEDRGHTVSEHPPQDTALLPCAVSEGESAARQQWRHAERIERLALEHEHSAMCTVVAEEAAARRVLLRWGVYGTCQARLSAIVKIQAWWRLTMQQPWASRTRDAMAAGICQCRNARTAADWQRRLAKMAASGGSAATAASVSPGGGWDDDLRRLEAAATLPTRYTTALDYYLFTLAERVKSFVECQQHEEEGGSVSSYLRSRPAIHHRVFFLSSQRRVSHYPRWRRSRWRAGSLHFQHVVEEAKMEETAARRLLCERQRQDANSLHAFAAALQSATVEAYLLALSALGDDEASERRLVELEAREADGILQVAWCEGAARVEAALRPLRLLCDEEAQARSRVEAEELQAAEIDLREAHWRWARLGECRTRLACRYTTTRGWRLAVRGGGVGAKFVSLHSAARVLQRFARRSIRQVRASRLQAAQEEQERDLAKERELRSLSTTLVGQLASLQCEWRRRSAASSAAASAVWQEVDDDDDDGAEASLEASARSFGAWFDTEADQPRDLQYKDVLARFHHRHAGFFSSLNSFLLRLRKERQRIEDDEAQERRSMQCHLAYRVAVSHTIVNSERRARMYLDAEEEDQRDQLSVDCAVTTAVIGWGVAAKSVPTGTAPETSRGTARVVVAALPKLTSIERLASREAVRRAAITQAGVRGFANILFDYGLASRQAIADEEAEELPIVCGNVDRLFDRQTPPIAQLSLLQAREVASRESLAAEALATSYASPLLRGHNMLLKDTLWPQYLFGHLSLSANGTHMDRCLVLLLTRRVGHVGAKLNDLVQLEESARRRIVYLEEITRELRFVYKKLTL